MNNNFYKCNQYLIMRDRIKKIISEKRFSISSFAKEIGVKQPTLNQQLAGDRNVSLEVVERILKTFPEISCDWIITGRGDMFGNPEYMTTPVESDARQPNIDLIQNNMKETPIDTISNLLAFVERQINAQREMMDKHLTEQREKAERELAKENELHALMLDNQNKMLEQKSIELENKNLLINSLQEELRRQTEQLNEITAKHDESLKIREEQTKQIEELMKLNIQQTKNLNAMAEELAEIKNQNKKILHIGKIGEERKAN